MRNAKSRRILGIIVSVLAVAIVAFVAIGLIFPASWPGKLLQGSGVGGAQPVYGTATVDGNPGEWAGDPVFTGMYRAWKTTKPLETNLYLRYDCATGTMYALVKTAGSWPVLVQPGEAWIAINSNSNKVSFTSFAYVGQSGDNAQGWEASFALAEGNYSLWAHTNVNDGGQQTSGIEGVGLTVQCHETTAATVANFTAQRQQAASGAGQAGSGGGTPVILRWQTASEVDNLGFNVYRGAAKKGPWTKINPQLIPSSVPPGSPTGANYEWTDNQAPKKVFYLLEAVDVNGATSQYGPVKP
jgi:hypothetical protein